MKHVQKYWIGYLIGLLILITIALFHYTEKYTVNGVVLEHNVTSNRDGKRIYSTLIKCNDGYIREKVGLDYYVMPIGNPTKVELLRLNFNK